MNYVKGKGTALDRSNYRGLELIEHALKVFERVIENLLRDKVDIGYKQFGFMPGKWTTDVIFVVRQVKVGVHQGSVLSPILFAIVLEALSRGFSDGLPWELLYADDIVIMADSLDELSVKLEG